MKPDFQVHVVRVADGETRLDDFDGYSDPAWSANEYWWTDGNFACDCNRSSYFDGDSDECDDGRGPDRRYRIFVTDLNGAIIYDERGEQWKAKGGR